MSIRTYYISIFIFIWCDLFTVQAQEVFSDSVDESVKGKFYQRDTSSARWIRSLKNVILISPKNESVADTFNVESYVDENIGATGRVIKKINIIRLEPFGGDIHGATDKKNSFLGSVGNTVHIDTREFIIRNALFFQEGDTIDVLKLYDSERYLRHLRFIDDALIRVDPVGDDEAEVTVITQDIFPYGVDFGTNFSSRVNLALSNRNIIGFGLETKAGVFVDSKKDHLMGYEFIIRKDNIRNTHVSTEAEYLDRYETRKIGISFNRDFYTPSTKYAGNITLYNNQIGVNYYDPDSSYAEINPVPVRFNNFDGWIGRSFQLKKHSFSRLSNNFTLALRAQETHFLRRPENSENRYYQFQNRTVYLGSLSYSRQAHYKTNLIFNYGRTEDIPYGYLFSLVGGKEYNELYNRPYFGANASAGFFIPNFGYLSGAATYGTFFRKKTTEQGSLDLSLNYFSNLFVIGKFRQRAFTNIQYSHQLNDPMNDYLSIDGDMGIPGFKNDSVLGRYRLNLSLEYNLFTPWNLYGFRFVTYTFANFSWLGNHNKPFTESTLYSSFGLGIRVRNNRLIINTIQIQLAFFPNIPKNSSFRYIHLTRETLLSPRDFSPKAPEIKSLY
ncbi:MAG: hypothetical protein LBQ60_17445 [Bacteroidales bacterium]|jgi:outer membrane protein assembly factor BamA|nr:hypothetical protein [Bacteroidales bacterium]